MLIARVVAIVLAYGVCCAPAHLYADEDPTTERPGESDSEEGRADRAFKARHNALRKQAAEQAKRGDTNGARTTYRAFIRFLAQAAQDREQYALVDGTWTAWAHVQIADRYGEEGDFEAAVSSLREALSIRRRLHGDEHASIATILNSLGYFYREWGRLDEAEEAYRRALVMRRRVFSGNHVQSAWSLHNLASLLRARERFNEALALDREALSMRLDLFGEIHPLVSSSYSNIASSLLDLGRHDEGKRLYKKALDLFERAFEGDHPEVSRALNNYAYALEETGQLRRAREYYERALAMKRRLYPSNHPDLALAMNGLASVLEDLGEYDLALSLHRRALRIREAHFERPHHHVSESLNNLGHILQTVGRTREALGYFERAAKMDADVRGEDHRVTSYYRSNVASALLELGEADQALALARSVLDRHERRHPSGHPDIALGAVNVSHALSALGRHEEAVALRRRALKIREDAFPDGHPLTVQSLTEVATSLAVLGRLGEAAEFADRAIELGDRLRLPSRHRARVLRAQLALHGGDAKAAYSFLQPALEVVEAQRGRLASLGAEGRVRFMAKKSSHNPFPLMVRILLALDRPSEAYSILEQGRGREFLDLLARGQHDLVAVARQRKIESSDMDGASNLDALSRAVEVAAMAVTHAKHAVLRARRACRRADVRAALRALATARRSHDDARQQRLVVIRDALPEGRSLRASEVQSLLSEGEVLLAYAVGAESFVFLVSLDGVRVFSLPTTASSAQLADLADRYHKQLRRPQGVAAAAAGHPGAELFERLVPAEVWETLRGARRVFVVAHGPVHRIPLEALVVGGHGTKATYWAEIGPPIVYCASGSVLAALASRPKRALDGLAWVGAGDPVFAGAAPWPADGVVVTNISPESQAAAAGLRRGDVLTRYDDMALSGLDCLRDAMSKIDPKTATRVVLTLDREGASHEVTIKPGPLGVHLAPEPPSIAGPKLLAETVGGGASSRSGLAPLPGTRAEVLAIHDALRRAEARLKTEILLGADATERRLYAGAQSPSVLHIATHGLVSPHRSALEASLALTPPRVPVPGDDGFLTLGDLLDGWRSRLATTQLVVLSACDTQTGRLDANEGMLALPWGFCFAGARSCIASHWPVGDKSTIQLMTLFYERLLSRKVLAPCEALHMARRAMMRAQPDPYHWAPFVFAGAP